MTPKPPKFVVAHIYSRTPCRCPLCGAVVMAFVAHKCEPPQERPLPKAA